MKTELSTKENIRNNTFYLSPETLAYLKLNALIAIGSFFITLIQCALIWLGSMIALKLILMAKDYPKMQRGILFLFMVFWVVILSIT